MSRHPWIWISALTLLFGFASCNRTSSGTPSRTSELADDNTPTFFLAWSEYPSWSVFGAAEDLGYIDGTAGRIGPIEKQLRVDLALQEESYESCLNMFQTGICDAVCMTNVDALIASGSRDIVAVLPTSARNRFVVETLGERNDVDALFEDGDQPAEIIDMVVIGQDTLDRLGADRFVKAIMEVFYQVNDELRGEQRDRVLEALCANSPNLTADEMREVVSRTEFYETPEAARDLMDSPSFREMMRAVEQICVEENLVTDPSVEYGPVAKGAQLRFDSSFLGTGD